MRRNKARAAAAEEQDLAYLVHDRVALLGRAFSLLSPRELRALVPACVRGASEQRLQEMCLDELLGISSKRLCSILDGAETPTDTETSTSESEPDAVNETVELDSSSSSSTEPSRRASRRAGRGAAGGGASNGASGGALTPAGGGAVGASVLQLLELTARARALRAQLANSAPAPAPPPPAVKEEAAPVVCISSDEAEQPAPAAAAAADHSPPAKKKKKRKAKEKSAPPAPPAPPTPPPEAGAGVKEKEPSDIVVLDSSPEREATSETEAPKDRDEHTPTDFTITIPHYVTTVRKIQLDKNNVVISVPNRKQATESVATPKAMNTTSSVVVPKKKTPVSVAIPIPQAAKINSTVTKVKKVKKLSSVVVEAEKKKDMKDKAKSTKPRKRSNQKSHCEDDELTLQVSDSEKQELLGDLNLNNDSDSVDSESDSEDTNTTLDTSNEKVSKNKEDSDTNVINMSNIATENVILDTVIVNSECYGDLKIPKVLNETEHPNGFEGVVSSKNINISNESTIEVKCIEDIPLVESESEPEETTANIEQSNECVSNSNLNLHQETEMLTLLTDSEQAICENNHKDSEMEETQTKLVSDKVESPKEDVTHILEIEQTEKDKVDTDSKGKIDESAKKETCEHSEEGEVSDKSDSDVEAFEVKPDVVIISDDETELTTKKKKKNKKKKSKKSKKQDFSCDSDDNFIRKAQTVDNVPAAVDRPEIIANNEITTETEASERTTTAQADSPVTIDIDSDNAYEVLEISDDSSCYEAGGVTVSKEPTAEEIEALSVRLDDLQRVDVVTGAPLAPEDPPTEDLEHVSWKDRYLDSAKVKTVLKTSNIFNALRKKNKELKRKLLESKNCENLEQVEVEEVVEKEETAAPVEGSIEHFNTLQGSNRYVDTVLEQPEVADKDDATVIDGADKDAVIDKDKIGHNEALQKEMKKDAKQLLKMYKRLLKYNDMNKQKPKDPNKKKKKKKKNSDPNVAKNVQNVVT